MSWPNELYDQGLFIIGLTTLSKHERENVPYKTLSTYVYQVDRQDR